MPAELTVRQFARRLGPGHVITVGPLDVRWADGGDHGRPGCHGPRRLPGPSRALRPPTTHATQRLGGGLDRPAREEGDANSADRKQGVTALDGFRSGAIRDHRDAILEAGHRRLCPSRCLLRRSARKTRGPRIHGFQSDTTDECNGGPSVNSRIEGSLVTPLTRIPDERGTIMHMLRADASHFVGFGEIYFSTLYPGAIRAWHMHKSMTLNFAVPVGKIKLVLYDDRPASPTFRVLSEHFVGEDSYVLLTVPPMVWIGLKGIGIATALVANCTTLPHDPFEMDRLDPFDPSIPYDWALRHR